MRKKISEGWVQDATLTPQQINQLKVEVETSRTRLSDSEWGTLIQFIERQIQIYNSRDSNSTDPERNSDARHELDIIESYFDKIFEHYDQLSEEHHNLLDYHFHLPNGRCLTHHTHSEEHSACEQTLQQLKRAAASSNAELRIYGKGQGRTKAYRFTFLITELIKFLEQHSSPITPTESTNTPFYKLVRFILSDLLKYDIKRPDNHIKTAFEALHEIP